LYLHNIKTAHCDDSTYNVSLSQFLKFIRYTCTNYQCLTCPQLQPFVTTTCSITDNYITNESTTRSPGCSICRC